MGGHEGVSLRWWWAMGTLGTQAVIRKGGGTGAATLLDMHVDACLTPPWTHQRYHVLLRLRGLNHTGAQQACGGFLGSVVAGGDGLVAGSDGLTVAVTSDGLCVLLVIVLPADGESMEWGVKTNMGLSTTICFEELETQIGRATHGRPL